MKTMRAGELRFIVKKIDKLWRVYDRARGSFPYRMPDLGGEILQDTDEKSAEAEAERLNAKYGPKLEQKKAEKSAKKAEKKQEAPVAEEVDTPEVADYGVLSEEEAARYEDGLMEKVTY